MDYARNFTSFVVVHCNVPIVLISVASACLAIIVPAMLGRKDTDRKEKN